MPTSPLGTRNEFRFEKGYSQGANGGLLEVHAPAQVWDGEIIAGVITGEREISSPAVGGTFKFGSTSIPDLNFHANNLLIQKETEALPDGFSMSSALPANRKIHPGGPTDMLNESGLAKLDINVNGDITFASSTDLELAPGSSLTARSNLPGETMVVDGSIRLPGGAVVLFRAGARSRSSLVRSSMSAGSGPIILSLLVHADRDQWRNDRTHRRADLRDGIGPRRQRRRLAVRRAQAEAWLGRLDHDFSAQRWPRSQPGDAAWLRCRDR